LNLALNAEGGQLKIGCSLEFHDHFHLDVPEIKDFTKQQFLNRDALVALLDRIGSSILLVHSQAGAFAWPVADARPVW
jgi:hypothetical protein